MESCDKTTDQERLMSLAPMAGAEDEDQLMTLLGKLQCEFIYQDGSGIRAYGEIY